VLRDAKTYRRYVKDIYAVRARIACLSVNFLNANKTEALQLAAVLNPVPKQHESCRYTLFPNGGIDCRNQGRAAFGLHLTGTLCKYYDSNISCGSELLKPSDDILKNLKSPCR